MGRGALLSPADKDHLSGCHTEQGVLGPLVRKDGGKSCELCHKMARIFCPADEAELCLACDRTVHSANFLVSRHSREVLCRSCGAPCTLSAFIGSGMDGYDGRHQCTQCVQRSRSGEVTRTELLSETSAVESGNSSCCTEIRRSSHVHVEVLAVAAGFQKKRLPVFDLNVEEGCGDSDDHRHRTTSSSKRTRVVALSRSSSHARPRITTATS